MTKKITNQYKRRKNEKESLSHIFDVIGILCVCFTW
jgi:hypothetical protein